mmetsp:Transcript_79805/g.158585  ORF Transcript_79805/g.158585 Transcript_79805/m.158585 type:complete len:327 (+) Transcript_79805:84-1064(+)
MSERASSARSSHWRITCTLERREDPAPRGHLTAWGTHARPRGASSVPSRRFSRSSMSPQQQHLARPASDFAAPHASSHPLELLQRPASALSPPFLPHLEVEGRLLGAHPFRTNGPLALLEEPIELGLVLVQSRARDIAALLRTGVARRMRRIEVLGTRPQRRHCRRVEFLGVRRVDGNADPPRLRVDAPRRLQQVVHALGHIDVETRVGVRENNLDEHRLQLWSLPLDVRFQRLPPLLAALALLGPVFEELVTDPLVAQHVEQLALRVLIVEHAKASLSLGGQDVRFEEGLEVLHVRLGKGWVHRYRDCQSASRRVELRAEVVGHG